MITGFQFIGSSPPISEIKKKIPIISATDATVLITGETGTGKGVLARIIHEQSERSNNPFVAINCGGIPKELLENELFGHKKGSYSHAYDSRRGLVEEAAGGTLFLDEIDSLPLDIQPKLLRLLHEREYRVLGDNKLQKADVRFVVASISNLEERVKERVFRADLFYRLNLLCLKLPLLKDRKEDILQLTKHFIKLYGEKYDKNGLDLPTETLSCLMGYDWPGNVRELEQAIHRAVIWCADTKIYPVHTGLSFKKPEHPPPDSLDWNQSYLQLKQQILERFEADYITKLLKNHKGNVTSASRTAGLDRRTLQRLMVKHSINRSDWLG